MKKILIGLVAVVAIAAGGYFGFVFYAQHRAVAEVEAAFDRMRSAGAKASHGKIAYDVWKRTITIADITTETATQPPNTVKIATLTASGLGQPEPGRLSADLVEGTDVELDVALEIGGTQLQYAYKLPKVTLTDCSAPSEVEKKPPAGASALDFYRFGIAQFTRFAASSVTVPTISAAVKLNSPALTDGEITYSGIKVEGIKDGRIATAKVDKATIAYTAQVADKSQSFTGTLVNLLVDQFDIAAAAAMLDPQKANDDSFHQMYRRISLDSYDIKSPPALHLSLGHVVLDDVALQPSHLQLPALLATMPKAGTTPTPAQARETLEKAAGIYEGLRLGNFEIDGILIDTPQGPAKLSTVRLNMDRGTSDIAVEGLDARTPQGPLKATRLAFKGLDFVKFLRLSATLTPGQQPGAEQGLALLQLIHGAEVKDLIAPSVGSKTPLSIDSLDIGWSQFVGPIPTQTHLAARMNIPISASDPRLQPLLAAGIQSTRINADIGAGWTESSGAIALEPATLEIAGLAKATARISLANVPRALFANPQQAASTAAQVETGAIEFTLHDLGGVDLLVSQYARKQNVSRDAARSAILEAIKTNGAQAAGASPDAAAAVAAIGRFVETPQQTLVIKLTPIGKLPAVALFQLLKSDPMAALAQFKIESSTGL